MSQQQDYAGYAWHASDQTVWDTTKADRITGCFIDKGCCSSTS